jgi:thiamine-phosphate pyrophosphorylase
VHPVGAHALVGQSRHSVDGVLAAAAEGADYVTIGPVWATPGKEPQGIDIVRDAAYELRVATDRGSEWSAEALRPAPQPRLFALGGIDTPERAAECVRAGAHGVAVIRAAARAAELLAAMEVS